MAYPTNAELVILSKSDLVLNINLVKSQIDELRPLSKDREDQIMQKLRLDWNYNSNAIEGNSLDYGETMAFLMHGVTAKGKPLKDYLDIRGHNDGINYLLELIRHNEELTEKDIRALHEMILVEPFKSVAQTSTGETVSKTIELGRYKSMPNHVLTRTGEIHYYATPEDTPILMGELMEWYRSIQNVEGIHPVVIAAIFHHQFVSIHPFDDGNGRMTRLLMNLILMKYHYPPVVIKKANKDPYYLALSLADSGNIEPFVGFIAENLFDTLQLYLRGARGESIEEPFDLDKKLILFKKEIEARKDRIEVRKSQEIIREIIDKSIVPMMQSYVVTIAKFKEFFLDQNEYVLQFIEGVTADRKVKKFWQYIPIDLNLWAETDVAPDLETDTAIIFASQLDKFKLEQNSFSLEVKILISFSELQYSVFYTISRANELESFTSVGIRQWLDYASLVKYYHQHISPQETGELVSDIGNKLFAYIKNTYENPSVNDLGINSEEVLNIWVVFVEDQYSYNENLRQNFITVASVSIFENRITIKLPDRSFAVVSSEKDSAETQFQEYLISKKAINVKPIVEIM